MAATVPVADLLARETTLSFAGLTPADQGDYPDAVSSEARCLDPDPRPLKDVIAMLPQASSGELWATNEFVDVDIQSVNVANCLGVDSPVDVDELVGRPELSGTGLRERRDDILQRPGSGSTPRFR